MGTRISSPGDVARDGWHRRVDWLWSQDDATPGEDTSSRAWRRLFGGEMPRGDGDWIARIDQDDAEILLDARGRAYVSSYPGVCELGVLRGSPASVLPRLIVSGGQTGADRGGLDAAIAAGVPIGGTAPRGWRAEDGQIPPIYRAHMTESESSRYEPRTIDNVCDTDGTLILSFASALTTGSAATRREAERRGRPCLHVPLARDVADLASARASAARASAAREILAWVEEHRIGSLNVAGPRQSKEPGIQEAACAVLLEVLRARDRAGSVDLPSVGPDLDLDDFGQDSDAAKKDPDVDARRESRISGGEDRASGRPASSPSEQDLAVEAVTRWMSSPDSPQVFLLDGPAGTGKTTLARRFASQASRSWLYASYTGKAALVMQQKGCAGARTIHSLIYQLDRDATAAAEAKAKAEAEAAAGSRVNARRTSPLESRAQPQFRLWEDSPLCWAPGVIVDEFSMVDRDLGEDLLSFRKKVLVLGDQDQLPPVSGGGFFTGRTPDFSLTHVYRQARGSGILDLATHVRKGGGLRDRAGWSSPDGCCEVISRDDRPAAEIMARMVRADQVLVGTNRTRHQFNDRYRRLSGISSPYPVVGDKVICLRNDRKVGLLNGSRWRVLDVASSSGDRVVEMSLATEDDAIPARVTVRSWTDHFLGRERQLDESGPSRMLHQEFDFGYYITCHKAQGSQWDDVVLYDESGVFDADTRRRWIYTGITRAAARLLVVV